MYKMPEYKNGKIYKLVNDELNLTYYQVANLSIGRSKQFEGSFKYQPKVEIKKIC